MQNILKVLKQASFFLILILEWNLTWMYFDSLTQDSKEWVCVLWLQSHSTSHKSVMDRGCDHAAVMASLVQLTFKWGTWHAVI